jgi:hypothetical protein
MYRPGHTPFRVAYKCGIPIAEGGFASGVGSESQSVVAHHFLMSGIRTQRGARRKYMPSGHWHVRVQWSAWGVQAPACPPSLRIRVPVAFGPGPHPASFHPKARSLSAVSRCQHNTEKARSVLHLRGPCHCGQSPSQRARRKPEPRARRLGPACCVFQWLCRLRCPESLIGGEGGSYVRYDRVPRGGNVRMLK